MTTLMAIAASLAVFPSVAGAETSAVRAGGQQISESSSSQAAAHQHPPEHEQMMLMTGPLGISFAREGSGTSWLPDGTPMHAVHWMADSWSMMLHGVAFLQYVNEGSPRGDDQFGSVNWVMAMGRRRVGAGTLTARGMLSLERLTVGRCGYPDLLATGEFCRGEPLHDRQHPHDLFMELAAAYEREIGGGLAVQAYGGLAGEPALGPTAFPHRPSSASLVLAPMTHHWLDSTHISFGVLTGGIFQQRWKAEASVFNGREPDEERYGLDLAALDSYSGRLSVLPDEHWSLQISAGKLTEAEPAHDGDQREDVRRVTASATYHRSFSADTIWTTTTGWGRNREDDESTHAFLAETNVIRGDRHAVFGRFEVAQKSAGDLAIADPARESYTVSKLQVGYERLFPSGISAVPGVGAAVTVNFTPSSLAGVYGDGPSAGLVVFVSVRPPRMAPMSHGMAPSPTRAGR